MGGAPTEHMGTARLIRFRDVDSTNAEALRRAARGDPGELWLVAGRQTQGRGRRARPWTSPPGNLHATLLLRPRLPAMVAGQLSFVAAVALFDAIVDCAGALAPGLSLKWPNDVLLGGAKVSGILLESAAGEGDGPMTLVIGFGVNCARHPDETHFPATDLAAAGASVDPDALLSALANRFAERRAQWAEGAGFGAVRRAWLDRAVGLGSAITVRLGTGEALAGTFADLDENGNLVLRLADGRERLVAAGDVFFAAPERA